MSFTLTSVKHFFRHQKGVSSVEFTLTIAFFLAVLFAIFELGRITIASAYWDYAVAEVVRQTRNTLITTQNNPLGYADEVRKKLINEYHWAQNSGWLGAFPLKLDQNSIKVKVNYSASLKDLVASADNNFRYINNRIDEPCAEFEQDDEGNEIKDAKGHRVCLKFKDDVFHDAAIARYEVTLNPISYRYDNFIAKRLNHLIRHLFKRQFFVVQEHQRAQFKDNWK